MSEYVCNLPTVSYFDFKADYYQRFPNSTYRLGQHYINSFIKVEDNSFDYMKLWEEKCITKVDEMVYKLIDKLQWDLMALQPVRKS